MVTVARYMTSEGKIPVAPDPAYVLIENGKPIQTLTADELDEIVRRGLKAKKDELG